MSRILLATCADGIARAALDSRAEWDLRLVAPGVDARCLAADPTNPNIAYAGTQGGGVLRTRDGGLTWSTAGLDRRIVKAVAASPIVNGRVYAGTKRARIFVSNDYAETWRELETFRRIPSRIFWFSPAEPPFTAYVQAIALSPVDPNLIVVGIEAGAVVRTTDGGATWEDHRPGSLRDCHSLAVHASAAVFYEGGSGGGAVSLDSGRTWSRLSGLDRLYGWAIAADPSEPSRWYVSVSRGALKAHSKRANAAIFAAVDGRWQRLQGGLPEPLDAMPYALIAGPEPGRLLAGLSSGELWETEDGGLSWKQLPVHLPAVQRSLITLEDLR